MTARPGDHYWKEVRLHTEGLHEFALNAGQVAVAGYKVEVPYAHWLDNRGRQVLWGADFIHGGSDEKVSRALSCWVSILSPPATADTYTNKRLEYQGYTQPYFLLTTKLDLTKAEVEAGGIWAGFTANRPHFLPGPPGKDRDYHTLLDQLRQGAALLLD